jgi:hypothetical protein
MDVFAERGTALQAVMNDRSAMQHVRAQTDFAKVLSGIMRQLAASDDPPTCFARNAPSVPCGVAC